MSLMTVEEIKEHLFNLLPTIIVQIDSNLDFRASFEKKTRIMIINEYQVFGNFITDNKNFFKVEPDSYVVPISMEMLSEIFGNIKLRYNNKDESSPLALRDSKNDFKCQKLMTKIKLNLNKEILINKGETGRVLEHYISENKNVIGILKKKNYNKEIIDYKFWIGKTFNALYEALDFKNEIINKKEFQEELILDDYDKEEYYDCVH